MKKYLISKLFSEERYYPKNKLILLVVLLSFIPLWLMTKVFNEKVDHNFDFDDSDDIGVIAACSVVTFLLSNIISVMISIFIGFSFFTFTFLPIIIVYIAGKIAEKLHKLNNSETKW